MTLIAPHASEAQWARLAPDTCTIQDPTVTQETEEGQVETTWATFVADVQCQFSPLGGSLAVRDAENRTQAGDFLHGTYQAILRGDYAVTESMRCVTRGKSYGIVSVHRDSYAIATVLHLEDLEPNSEEESS